MVESRHQIIARQMFAAGWPSRDDKVIQARNDYVLSQITPETHTFLDIGCGEGELVQAVSKKGIDVLGIDSSEAMTRKAKDKCPLKIRTSSVFDIDLSTEYFDLISANGVIEYFSHDELRRFILLVTGWLKDSGVIVLSARNRLYNITSFNEYTQRELNEGAVPDLVKESVEICKWKKTMGDYQTPLLLQRENDRLQYTPCQLAALLRGGGIMPIDLYPIHLHSWHPSLPEDFDQILQHYPKIYNRYKLIPYASSFMMKGVKK